MDMPIYLHFLDSDIRRGGPESQYRNGAGDLWYVIEEKGDSETAVDDELDPKQWSQTSGRDRVRHLRLPQLHYDFSNAAFAVSNSRLFFVGGMTIYDGHHRRHRPIHLVLKQSNPSWERCDKWAEDVKFPSRPAAVSNDGNSIYAVAEQKFLCFDCRNVDVGDIHYPPRLDDLYEVWPSTLLDVTVSKVLMFIPASRSLGYYNLEDKCWENIVSVPQPNYETSWCFDSSEFSTVVRESFLIYFPRFRSPPSVTDYGPALYVYDIKGCKWLPQPVLGLPNDDFILPHPETELPVMSTSLMQIRRDVLKFALVWTIAVEDNDDGTVSDQTVIHWTKFTLCIKDQDNGPPTFHAEDLSSGICFGGNISLVNSSAG